MLKKYKRRAKYASTYIAPHKRYRDSQIRSRGSAKRRLKSAFRAISGVITFPFIWVAGLFNKKQAKPSIGSAPQKRENGASTPAPPNLPLKGGKAPADKNERINIGNAIALGLAALFSLLFMGWALLFSDTSILVNINYNDISRNVKTKAVTVSQLLEENSIELKPEDSISHPLEAQLENDMEITIKSAFPVAVASKGMVTVLQMREGSVGQALAKAGIDYDAQDEITHLTYEDVEPGMHIQHIEIETKYETMDQVVNFNEEVLKDPSRFIDYIHYKIKGEEGLRRVVRRLIYKDGELVTSEIMNQITLKEAVDQVVVKGTKIKYQTNFSGDTREWRPKPTDDEIKSTMVVQEITAYTHTGKRTATGRWPKIGYVAVNPNIIPYGTRMYIPGYGYCSAQDTGAFRHEQDGMKNQIDLFMNTAKECLNWGRKRNITIYILK